MENKLWPIQSMNTYQKFRNFNKFPGNSKMNVNRSCGLDQKLFANYEGLIL